MEMEGLSPMNAILRKLNDVVDQAAGVGAEERLADEPTLDWDAMTAKC